MLLYLKLSSRDPDLLQYLSFRLSSKIDVHCCGFGSILMMHTLPEIKGFLLRIARIFQARIFRFQNNFKFKTLENDEFYKVIIIIGLEPDPGK
jgi:hypothetical protein